MSNGFMQKIKNGNCNKVEKVKQNFLWLYVLQNHYFPIEVGQSLKLMLPSTVTTMLKVVWTPRMHDVPLSVLKHNKESWKRVLSYGRFALVSAWDVTTITPLFRSVSLTFAGTRGSYVSILWKMLFKKKLSFPNSQKLSLFSSETLNRSSKT